jgi:hypothetical protein
MVAGMPQMPPMQEPQMTEMPMQQPDMGGMPMQQPEMGAPL